MPSVADVLRCCRNSCRRLQILDIVNQLFETLMRYARQVMQILETAIWGGVEMHQSQAQERRCSSPQDLEASYFTEHDLMQVPVSDRGGSPDRRSPSKKACAGHAESRGVGCWICGLF